MSMKYSDSEWEFYYQGPLFQNFKLDWHEEEIYNEEDNQTHTLSEKELAEQKRISDMLDAAEKSMFGEIPEELDDIDEEEDDDEEELDEGVPVYCHDPEKIGLSDFQRSIQKAIMSPWPDMEAKVIKSIIRHLKNLDTDNYVEGENVPFGFSREPELLHTIELSSIHVSRHSKTGFGLSFKCAWDEEHGLGVRIIDQDVVLVDHSEIAYND